MSNHAILIVAGSGFLETKRVVISDLLLHW